MIKNRYLGLILSKISYAHLGRGQVMRAAPTHI